MLQMSHTEIDRFEAVQKIIGRQIKQLEASNMLDVSYRQVKRIVKQYRKHGAKGLVSKRRGKPSNNRIETSIKQKALTILRRL